LKNMRIPPTSTAFDFDGVIADTFRLFVRMARELYGYSFDYDDITEYEFLKSLEMERGHASEILAVLNDDLPDIDLFPNHGAQRVLERLTNISRVLVVTARPDAGPVELWFSRRIPGVDPGCLTIVATGLNTAKLEVLREKNVTHFVDDRLDTCRMIHEAGITPVVFDQPWNRRPHPFLSVGSWEELDRLMDWETAPGSVLTCAGRHS